MVSFNLNNKILGTSTFLKSVSLYIYSYISNVFLMQKISMRRHCSLILWIFIALVLFTVYLSVKTYRVINVIIVEFYSKELLLFHKS